MDGGIEPFTGWDFCVCVVHVMQLLKKEVRFGHPFQQ